MHSYKRSVRVAELIQQEISKIIQNLKNHDKGFITITGIKLTDDLKSARIYYSIYGSEEERKKNGKLLQESLPEIRHQLAMRLNLRRTPELALEYDNTPEKADRIFNILEQIKSEEEREPKKKKDAEKLG